LSFVGIGRCIRLCRKERIMALFVAQHQHRPESCPAAHASGFLLLDHVSAATAAWYGVAIQAEAVLDGAHGLVLVLEAADRARVEAFMEFFARWGEVQVFPASPADEAVSRGGCGFEDRTGRSSPRCEESPVGGSDTRVPRAAKGEDVPERA
jgi:hypothetical protein